MCKFGLRETVCMWEGYDFDNPPVKRYNFGQDIRQISVGLCTNSDICQKWGAFKTGKLLSNRVRIGQNMSKKMGKKCKYDKIVRIFLILW